jgi:hypothetical protein
MRRTVVVATLLALGLVFPALSCGGGGGDGTVDPGGCPDGSCIDGVQFDTGSDEGADLSVDSDANRDGITADTDVGTVDDADVSPLDIAETDVPKDGEFGAPCDTNDQCVSGFCVPSVAGSFCTLICVENCPEGYSCKLMSPPGQDSAYVCMPPETSLCRPCTGDSDCTLVEGEVARCLGYDKIGRFCATDCTTVPCSRGYTCTDTTIGADTVKLCVADSGDCPCLQGFAGLSTPCFESNPDGTCDGARKCAQIGLAFAWEACTAPVPAPETCNDIDDNCDGKTDEGLGDSICGLGVCAHIVPGCLDGRPGDCDKYQGQTVETCNNLDDDCDGLTDELWPDRATPCDGPDADKCTNGLWGCADDGQSLVCESDDVNHAEVCNSIDDDCDGSTDEAEDLGQTTCGVGVCLHSVPNCLGGFPQSCNPLEGALADDLPDPDYLDTNCDGIDGDILRSVFVDITSGKDFNPGTVDLPKRTIQAGIDTAAAEAKPIVIVSLGTYSETVSLKNGVGVYGQYDRASGWQRKPENITQIRGGRVAVYADNLTASTGLHGFSILSESATEAGGSSYGVMARNSPGLILIANTIQAGSGSQGIMGTMGALGLNGGAGERGLQGCEYDAVCIDPFSVCNKCSRPSGGGGGISPCGNPGGGGGNGGDSDGNGASGAAGTGTGGGYAGTGGVVASPGYPGGGGSSGSNGQPGTGGPLVGVIGPEGYVVGDGLNGKNGTNGSGGGGGGSGGGDSPGFCQCRSFGGAGGGGGGAGCGGGGGVGGGGGGASVGIYVYGAGIQVSRTIVKTGNGGSGGPGGYGATGGLGGTGGSAGPGDTDSAAGAAGGKGGKGGNGGHGGGGGGGPSVGILCANGFAGLDTVSFSLGMAGEGGQSAGYAGQSGLGAQTYGCGQ